MRVVADYIARGVAISQKAQVTLCLMRGLYGKKDTTEQQN